MKAKTIAVVSALSPETTRPLVSIYTLSDYEVFHAWDKVATATAAENGVEVFVPDTKCDHQCCLTLGSWERGLVFLYVDAVLFLTTDLSMIDEEALFDMLDAEWLRQWQIQQGMEASHGLAL